MDAKRSKSRGQDNAKVATAKRPADSSAPAKSSRRTLITVPLIVGALLPFGLSIYFCTQTPTAQAVTVSTQRSPIAFGQYMVNLGLVPAGRKYESAWFAFMNKGTETLTLGKPIASCQCINPSYIDDKMQGQKNMFRPGEKGKVQVYMETARETAGEKEFQITVPWECGTQKGEAELTFRLALPEPQVVLNPSALIFYNLNLDDQKREFKIVDNRSKPLNFVGFEQTSELPKPISEVKYERTEDADGVRTITFTVNVAGKMPDRRVRESIHIQTDDPEFKTLRLPLWLDGRKISMSHPTEEKR